MHRFSLAKLASHTIMGVALGLAFSRIMVTVDQYGIAGLIDQGATQKTTRLEFVGFVVLAFAIGVTLYLWVFHHQYSGAAPSP
jgi:ABC-type anion transport system duplicated permease subunit